MLSTAIRWACCVLSIAAFVLGGYFVASDSLGHGPEATASLAAGMLLLCVFLALGRKNSNDLLDRS